MYRFVCVCEIIFMYVFVLINIFSFKNFCIQTTLCLKPQGIGLIKNSYWNVVFIHKNLSDFSIYAVIGTSKSYKS